MPHEWRSSFEAARAHASAFRPFVTAAFALSRDGFLSESRGQQTLISSPPALQMTHALRAAHDAILVGRGTQQTDDPRLTTRFETGRTGLRVVLDSQLALSPQARLVTSEERPVVVFATQLASREKELVLRGLRVDVERVATTERGVALTEVLVRLANRGVSSVMVEGGADVLESFFSEGLVDFICLTTSPRELSKPDAVGCGAATRAALTRWRPETAFSAGDDVITAGAFAFAGVEATG